MGEYDDEDYVYCTNCEKEILKEKAIYVGGRPYCINCYRDAEVYETIDVYNDEEDEDEEEEDEEEEDEEEEDEDDDDYD